MEEKSTNKKEQEFNACCKPASSSCCTPASSSCCTPTSTSCDCSELSQTSSSNMVEEGHTPKLRNPDKLNIDIYVPLKACSCEWSDFMNSVFIELTPFMKFIDHQTKDMQTKEAVRLGIRGKCIVIDDKTKISSAPLLKKQLPGLLKERGLI